jgi:hypothetical protein
MRRPLSTQSDFVNVGSRLLDALNANSPEIPHFDPFRDQLASMLEEIQTLMAQQDALTASKQTVSKRIKAIHEDGTKLIKFLRRMALQHYGKWSEKLVEFGAQPFRGRPRRLEDTVTTPVSTTPPTIE